MTPTTQNDPLPIAQGAWARSGKGDREEHIIRQYGSCRLGRNGQRLVWLGGRWLAVKVMTQGSGTQ